MKNTVQEKFGQKGYYLTKAVFSAQEIQDLAYDFDRIVGQLMASGEVIDATWKGANIRKIAGSEGELTHTHKVHQYSANC